MGQVADNVLEIRDLCVDYRTPRGRLQALRHVDIDVPRKSIVGIVSESGCGKSTLISTVIRLLAANAVVASGRVLFDRQDLLRMSQEQVRALRGDRLSMIFQDPMTTHNPVLSIGGQMVDIQYRSRASRAEKRKRAADMLALVGIPDAAHRLDDFPHQFSGGMRQRIAIAMALMAEPDLLIADEPTTALDATLEVQIIHLLRELQDSLQCSILFISHHLGVVAELCDYVVVMYAGEVVEQGSVRDIFHNASHPYAQKLFECDPARIREKTRTLPTIPGDTPDLVDLPPGCIFRARCPHAYEPCAAPPPQVDVGAGHRAACHRLVEPAQP